MRFNVYYFFLLTLIAQGAFAQDLIETYKQVQLSDPRLQIDALGVEVGVAREKQSFGALLPQVSINGNITSNTRRADGLPIDHYSGKRYTLSISQPIFDLGKFHAWQRSGAVLEQFKFNLDETKTAVRLDTIERYFALLQANDELSLVREQQHAVQTKKDQTQALYNKQLVKITDLYEIIARLDLLGSEEVDAAQRVSFAQASLSELTQQLVTPLATLNEHKEFDLSSIGSLAEHTSQLVATNPALKALKKSIKAAKLNLSQQKAGHYPIIAVQLNKQKSDIGYDNSASGISDTEVAGLTLSMPIFSGGTTSARVSEARQQLAISRATFDQEYRKAVKELQDEYQQVKALVRRIQASKKAVKSAGKSSQAMDKSFLLNIATVTDVLDAKQLYLEAKRSLQQALYDYIISSVRLSYKIGSLGDKTIEEVNAWLNIQRVKH